MTGEPLLPFSRVGLVGLGVMGGSLARALTRLPAPPRVAGWSPEPRERAAAREAGVLDVAAREMGDALAGCDLVVLAAPLGACVAALPEVARRAPAGAVVTDVAGLKAPVLAAVEAQGLGARWVGSHPMCGSAASGFAASRADLFQGARVWVTALPAAEPAAHRVAAFWRALGAEPVRTDAADHDTLMARVSHLPQLTANALARVLADAGVRAGTLGTGGRDMTRLAASSAPMWRDILAHAPAELPALLRRTGSGLEELARLVEAGDLDALEAWMDATRAWKEAP